jgi:Transposase domain (DUF772)
MMGPRQVDQAALFYEFSLERHVPATHLLRSIDRFVDLSDVRSHLAPFYSSTGRPSIDPELLVRMLLVGYYYGISSALPLGLMRLTGRSLPGRTDPSGNISTPWMRLLGARQARRYRSSSPSRIRPHNGPALTKDMPSLPMPTTT